MDKIWNNYSNIGSELKEIKKIMRKNCKCKDKVIQNSIYELIESGGKMIRPAFVIIGSHFGEYNGEHARTLGAVVEMLHMATLVHDDVIDEARLRRGNETIQSKYGKDYAVYIGDFLFCVCFKLLANNASLNSIQVDTKSMSRICLGEIDQLNSRFSKDISVKKYLSRISGKTAELFSLSLYIGASEAKADKITSRKLWRIGHNVGMAFQIIDDVLDYIGDDVSIRKSAGNDLKQGIFTIPFIYAYESNKSEFNEYFNKDYLDNQDVEKIISKVKEYNGVDKAMALARKYTKKAFRDIDSLPENEYREILKELCSKLLFREY